MPPIGDARIEIEIPNHVAPNHVIPIPPATEVTDGKVIWHYKDFRPTEELTVLFARSQHLDKNPDGEQMEGDSIDFRSVADVKAWLEFAKINGFNKDGRYQW